MNRVYIVCSDQTDMCRTCGSISAVCNEDPDYQSTPELMVSPDVAANCVKVCLQLSFFYKVHAHELRPIYMCFASI